jgi:ketosteroid isomerase-like protein
MSSDWLIAHEQIRQLASHYAVAMNHRDLDQLVSLFVDDVRVGADAIGHDALRADFDRQLRAIGVTILQVTNHVIDVDVDQSGLVGDTASGIVSCRGEIEIDDAWIVQQIEYHDTYARRDGRWRFVRRRHLLYYGAPLGVSPLGLDDAHWPRHAVGRGTLPFSLPTWTTFWAVDE